MNYSKTTASVPNDIVIITFKQVLHSIVFCSVGLFVIITLWPIYLLGHFIPFIGTFCYCVTYSAAKIELRKAIKIRKKIFEYLKNYKNEKQSEELKILEIGPGDGINFELYPPGSVISTLEINAHLYKQVDSIREKYSNMTIDNLMVGNIENVKDIIQDNTFDVIVGTHLFCCVKQKDKGLLEVHRILKPGGMYLCYENIHYKKDQYPLLRIFQKCYAIFHKFLTLGCHGGSFDFDNILARNGFDTSSLSYVFMEKLTIMYAFQVMGPAFKTTRNDSFINIV